MDDKSNPGTRKPCKRNSVSPVSDRYSKNKRDHMELSGKSPPIADHPVWTTTSEKPSSPTHSRRSAFSIDRKPPLEKSIDQKPSLIEDHDHTPSKFELYVSKIQGALERAYERRKSVLKIVLWIIFAILYHAYFVVALVHNFRKAVALVVITIIVWLFVIYYYVYKPYAAGRVNEVVWEPLGKVIGRIWMVKYVRWCTYGLIALAIVIFLAIDTANNRYRLVSLAGLSIYVLLGFVFSTNPARINWRPVIWSLLSQLIIALLILRWPPGLAAFVWLSDQIVRFLNYTYEGTNFVYGFLSDPPNICGMSPVIMFSTFQVIVFFGSVVAVLYYYGVVQWILVQMATAMEYTMGTTAAESLFAAACVFLGQSEAGIVIRPYLAKMTTSEIHQIMTSGFACIAGSLFAAYISFGACPLYLLSASIMSCPASLAASKLFYPETEKSKTKSVKDLHLPKGQESNVIEAISNGACGVVEMIIMIGANLIVFIALVAFLNNVVGWLGEMVGVEGLSFELIYSYLFFPLAFLMGASDSPDWDKRVQETMAVAELIGTKTILNEFIAYKKMGEFVAAGKISGRAQMIATYALCGFSNIGSIGCQIACLTGLCPEKKTVYPRIAVRALIAGSVSCFITASFAGLLVSDPIACKPSMQRADCFNISAHM